MDKMLRCRDLGGDCEFVACAPTEQEVLVKTGRHIQIVHKMKGFSKEFYDRAQTFIQDGYCESGNKDALDEGVCRTEACVYTLA